MIDNSCENVNERVRPALELEMSLPGAELAYITAQGPPVQVPNHEPSYLNERVVLSINVHLSSGGGGGGGADDDGGGMHHDIVGRLDYYIPTGWDDKTCEAFSSIGPKNVRIVFLGSNGDHRKSR